MKKGIVQLESFFDSVDLFAKLVQFVHFEKQRWLDSCLNPYNNYPPYKVFLFRRHTRYSVNIGIGIDNSVYHLKLGYGQLITTYRYDTGILEFPPNLTEIDFLKFVLNLSSNPHFSYQVKRCLFRRLKYL